MQNILSTYTTPLQWNLTAVPEELLWYMTGIFLLLTLTYLSSAFYFRTRLKNRTSREAERKKELAPMISKFLFYTEEDPLEAKREYVQLKIQIRQLLKDGLTRSVLSEVLQDLKKDVSGSARRELLNLYRDLGLQEDAIQRLKSRKWEVLARAILELTEMEVKDAYTLIKGHINHRSSIVRKQAQIATVSLKAEGITYFMDSNRYPISEWQQLKLLDVIRHLEGFEAPKFKNWLTSKNTHIVLFALRLIKYYKQNDARKAIIRLVNHRNQQIKMEAIQCIREFFILEAKEPLKMAFPNGNEEVRLLILDTLGLIGDQSDICFLQGIVNETFAHTISSKASSVINTLQPDSILPEEGIENTEGIEIITTQDKSENMEKEEKEVLSPQLPKPDLPDHPEIWEDFLDQEFEDELIFSHCCLEEFRELIQQIGEPMVQAGDPGTLPLDFLPIVVPETEEEAAETSEPAEQTFENPTETAGTFDYPLHAEERITREIEALLELEEVSESDQGSEDDFNLNFLPILVDDSAPVWHENKENDIDFHSIEVIAETLKYKVPEAFENIHKPSENYSIQVPPEASFEAVKAIDWSAIAKQNLELSLEEQREADLAETTEGEDNQYGFSIFQELFRTADTESKLILLNEILAIGDQKELYFLKTLSEDPSPLVRKKAVQIQAELASRLIQDQELETPDVADECSSIEDIEIDTMFELSFEPEADCFRNTEQEQEEAPSLPQSRIERSNDSGSLLGKFMVLTHKFFEKVYG